MCRCKDTVRWGHIRVDMPYPHHVLSLLVVGPSEPSRERAAMSVGKGEGGVGLRPVHVAGKASMKAVNRVIVSVHKPRGASLDVNALPALTKGTTSIKLISVAEKATTAEPEALEPRAESIA